MAKFKCLRGGALDIFGKTEERRMERGLIRDYEALIAELLQNLTAENAKDKLELAVKLARLPETIRGYGHVKLANVVNVKAQWKDLLDRFHERAVESKAVTMPQSINTRIKGAAEL